ncbi:hypothetical protein SDRG_16341 [Saprolegnia diclina VS20]|uniref:Uncharacterized protein n=1 Tax=Saprolegnia diclina (strain VS20) TaxID=1156394 RepID=T0R1B5_SAPDV|nr:hypothetical protein SDRG_16341 [Saprolegnia diclina VS20]EQC25793.1 hypothetical protein SDRG_16341 [Saprolegnia diclina VS20]|eukprot:XP_008620768.1 hypothetical protein SDRG_16341 [Saprolegnia diclina VS20]
MDKAARRGHLAMVRFLHTYRSEGCSQEAMASAAHLGHLAVVQFLHQHRTEGTTTDAIDWAAASGHLRPSFDMWTQVADLQPLILAFAGPLTQYLCGALDDKQLQNNVLTSGIWRDAFRLDWPGDLDRLPALEYLVPKDYRCIRSRAMYAKVLAIRSIAGKPLYFKRAYCNKSMPPHEHCGREPWPCDIEIRAKDAAPMENLWLDLLASFLERPVALAQAAIAGGHIELLRYLNREKSVDIADVGYVLHFPPRVAMDVAATNGHLEVLQLLHDGGASCTTAAMDGAAANGYLSVVQWLHDNRTEGCSEHVLDTVAGRHPNVATYLLQRYSSLSLSSAALDGAAKDDYIDVVVELHEKWHAPCTTKALDGAAYSGDLDIVRFLHEHRDEGCTPLAMDAAAQEGHLDVVTFLTEHRTEGCTVNAMDHAARGGHEDIVVYLHTHRSEGCTTRAIDWAASAGHLSVVQFLLRERAEGFTFRGIFWAAKHPEVLAVLLEHDVTKKRAADAVDTALKFSYRDVYERLRAAGCLGTSRPSHEMSWIAPNPNIFLYISDDADEDAYDEGDSDALQVVQYLMPCRP